jgi:hypothetical protein
MTTADTSAADGGTALHYTRQYSCPRGLQAPVFHLGATVKHVAVKQLDSHRWISPEPCHQNKKIRMIISKIIKFPSQMTLMSLLVMTRTRMHDPCPKLETVISGKQSDEQVEVPNASKCIHA